MNFCQKEVGYLRKLAQIYFVKHYKMIHYNNLIIINEETTVIYLVMLYLYLVFWSASFIYGDTHKRNYYLFSEQTH